MQSKLRIFATAFLVFSLSLFVFLFISPREVDAGDKVKIPLCHVTASSTNRYVYIEVAPSAVDGDGKNDHTHHVQYDNENTAYYDLWTGDGRRSVINGPDDCPGGAVVVTETHSLRLTSMCTDLKTEKNIWRVFHKDTSDYFYPVLLGYEIYSGPISTIDKFFTYNHTEATRFTDPYLFRTPVTGESQTVKLYWWNYITDKWVYSDTKESNNEACEPVYEACDSTIRLSRGWSDWKTNPEDSTEEYRQKTTYIVDSVDNKVQCADPVVQTETRYKECSSTVREFSRWSGWMTNPEDPTEEYRIRLVYILDSQNSEKQCARPVTQTETRYILCSNTYREFGEWSDWMVDPENDSMEYREREAWATDSQDSEEICAGPIIQKETQERELCEWDTATYADDPLCVEPNGNGDTEEDDEGDVLGVDDEAEVKGTTTVVYASTAAGDRSTIFLIQSILLIATGFSLIYVGKEYLNRY